MAELSTIIRQLQKGKNVESGLALFSSSMMNTANRLSFVRLAMNFCTLYEVAVEMQKEGIDVASAAGGSLELLCRLVETACRDGICGEAQEQAVVLADNLRESLMKQVRGLNYYYDCFAVEEYVLNRVEYRFRAPGAPYSEDLLRQEIMQYITSDQDRIIMRDKISSVIGQLPLRMTKQRFLQIVQDGLSVYTGSEQRTVSDLIYMIRTSALLEEPENALQSDPELAGIYAKLKDIDSSSLDRESYEAAGKELEKGTNRLNNLQDLAVLEQGLVNDLYVIFLSSPYAMYDVEERSCVHRLLEQILALFRTGTWREVPEDYYDGFLPLEGVQERLYESFSQCDAVLEELSESYKKLIPGLMLDKIFCSLSRISKLLSDNLFIDLEENGRKDKADEAYVMQAGGKLRTELEAHLKKMSKLRARAVMSKVLEQLPPFLNTYSELEEYVSSSLASCTDEAERYGCMEILHQMMIE